MSSRGQSNLAERRIFYNWFERLVKDVHDKVEKPLMVGYFKKEEATYGADETNKAICDVADKAEKAIVERGRLSVQGDALP